MKFLILQIYTLLVLMSWSTNTHGSEWHHLSPCVIFDTQHITNTQQSPISFHLHPCMHQSSKKYRVQHLIDAQLQKAVNNYIKKHTPPPISYIDLPQAEKKEIPQSNSPKYEQPKPPPAYTSEIIAALDFLFTGF